MPLLLWRIIAEGCCLALLAEAAKLSALKQASEQDDCLLRDSFAEILRAEARDLGVFDGEEEAGVVFAGRNCVSHADQADHTVQLHALKKLLENEVAQAAAASLPEDVDTGGDAGDYPTLPLLAVILQKDLSLLWHKGRERGAGENFVFSNRLMRGVARLRHVLPRLARYVLLTWERKSAESVTLGSEVRAREDTIVRELENRVRFFVRSALYAYDARTGNWVLRTDAPSPKQWLLAISKNKHDLTLAVTQKRSEKEKSWLREVELNGDRHLLSALEWVFVSALALAWEELQQELCAILVATTKGAAHTEPMSCESGGVWDNYVERELWTYSLAEALATNATVKLDGQYRPLRQLRTLGLVVEELHEQEHEDQVPDERRTFVLANDQYELAAIQGMPLQGVQLCEGAPWRTRERWDEGHRHTHTTTNRATTRALLRSWRSQLPAAVTALRLRLGLVPRPGLNKQADSAWRQASWSQILSGFATSSRASRASSNSWRCGDEAGAGGAGVTSGRARAVAGWWMCDACMCPRGASCGTLTPLLCPGEELRGCCMSDPRHEESCAF